jgi:hypothetical protein
MVSLKYHLHLTDRVWKWLNDTGFGQYGEMNNAWTSDDAGFIKIQEMHKTYFHL